MIDDKDMCLDWDSEITNDSQDFIFIEPEKDLYFAVKAFTRANYPGSAKLPPCKKATMTLDVDVPGRGSVTVEYDLILHKKLEWKISEFFRAIGMKKHGETIIPNWQNSIGKTGKGRFGVKTWVGKDGKERKSNTLLSLYDYEPKEVKSFSDMGSAVEMDEL